MTSDTPIHARRARAALAAALALAATLAACDREDARPAAGAMPDNAYFIGPQPGPDRALLAASNPYSGNRGALDDGRRLFVWYNCSGCHGDYGGGGMGPSLRDSLWRYGGDDASIFASIAEGRRDGMPSWGSKVPQEQIWKIVTYIQSMRTANEPAPPPH